MTALRVAGIYLVAGVAWVLASDWVLARLAPEYAAVGQSVKGLAFVGLSTALIYLLLSRAFSRRDALAEDRGRLVKRLAATARFEAIGQLAGGIAHDFNNLLTAVSGNLEGYLRQLPPDARSEELLEAKRATDRGSALTRQLLAFGRRQVSNPELVDINGVIREMSTLLHRLIGERVRIVTELGPDLRTVLVDRAQLEQVVMNLAINARDAMPDGGTLRLRTSNERIGPVEARRYAFPVVPGHYVRLDVLDTGEGMSAEVQARIFEPFFTTKPKEVGTGLGLATVYGIVKQSEGHITVQSEPGRGSTFTVLLPQVRGPATDGDAGIPADLDDVDEAVHSGTETVLVVEDDRVVRSLLTRILERRGFSVLEAPDGPEALTILRARNGQVDLVVTDAMMPQMTGLELADAVRSLRPALPVLLISGHDEESFQGRLPYLAKPFTHTQLVRRIRQLLDAR